jgi:hypothetical protein
MFKIWFFTLGIALPCLQGFLRPVREFFPMPNSTLAEVVKINNLNEYEDH